MDEPAPDEICVQLRPDEPREIGGRGVEFRRPTGTGLGLLTVEEIAVTYRPRSGEMSVLVPPLPATGESGGPSFSMSPGASGTFTLEAHPTGGRPRLTLESGRAGVGGSHAISTVEGGNDLSIRASVDAGDEAELRYRNLGPETVPPLRLRLIWP